MRKDGVIPAACDKECVMAKFFDKAVTGFLKRVPMWITPNMLSVARAAFAIPVVCFRDAPWLAVTFLINSSLYDLMDGPLARYRGIRTRLGPWLDSMADKVFVLIVMYGACFDRIPLGLCITVTVLEVLLIIVRIVKERYRVKTDSNAYGAIKTWSQSFGLAFILTQSESLYLLSSIPFGLGVSAAVFSVVFHLFDFRRPT